MTAADADAVGRLHVRAWQAAYRGQMPDDLLDGLRPEDRAAAWRRAADEPRARSATLVAERDGAVLGFVAIGPARPPLEETTGELYAINVEPDEWGGGAGHALVVAGTGALRGFGFTTASLWVLPGNGRARRFYEREGWRNTSDEKTEELSPGVTVTEVRYERQL